MYTFLCKQHRKGEINPLKRWKTNRLAKRIEIALKFKYKQKSLAFADFMRYF